MPIGKRDGKIDSPTYKGQPFPSDLPSKAGDQTPGTASPTGSGMSKNPPAGSLPRDPSPKGNLATSGRDLPSTSGPGRQQRKAPE